MQPPIDLASHSTRSSAGAGFRTSSARFFFFIAIANPLRAHVFSATNSVKGSFALAILQSRRETNSKLLSTLMRRPAHAEKLKLKHAALGVEADAVPVRAVANSKGRASRSNHISSVFLSARSWST